MKMSEAAKHKKAPWLIGGTLRQGDLILLTGNGCNEVASSMVMCLGTGTPWCGRRVSRRYSSITISRDDHRVRSVAWCKYHGFHAADDARRINEYAKIICKPINLSDDDEVERAVNDIERQHVKVDLVILDAPTDFSNPLLHANVRKVMDTVGARTGILLAPEAPNDLGTFYDALDEIINCERKVEDKPVNQSHLNPVVEQYVKHLPEVGPEIMNEPGVHHVVFHHEDWCGIFKGQRCNCSPGVKFYAEPNRS
jgi:hypothetical protein